MLGEEICKSLFESFLAISFIESIGLFYYKFYLEEDYLINLIFS